VSSESEKEKLRINHPRSGDIIAISDVDKWFSYYWWYDDEKAPDFTRTVDIHRKPGYDPAELFFDPKTKSIPLNPSLVKGSHGRPVNPATGEGYAAYVSSSSGGDGKKRAGTNSSDDNVIKCVDIAKHLFGRWPASV
jgi:hypothetical protein